jgi:S1-C subfamily serine protease
MRAASLAVVTLSVILIFGVPLHSQAALSRVSIRVILVDQDLNQKSVPHLSIVLTPLAGGEGGPLEVKTDFAGNAEIQAAPGTYRLATPGGVDYQGHHFSWNTQVTVGNTPCSVDLSNDNASVAEHSPGESARQEDRLPALFQKFKNSVVTVWSEIGSGSGFIVDPAGLVMTNQHVIGPSKLVSVQFDARRKVAARVLAVDAERDVAILFADLSAFPAAAAAPLAAPESRRELAVEGERVFTIGSPLGLKKVITSGIVSKVEARAILSDVNINHGNSGGPLFNFQGQVIGITTFIVPGGNGPGVAGVIRIDQALPALSKARERLADADRPSARLLPVEPADPYPLDSLKEMSASGKFDRKPYIFTLGGYDVALGTPVLKYEVEAESGHAASQGREKRIGAGRRTAQNPFEPLQNLHEWAEYIGEFKPVLLIQAAPQFRETLLSVMGRELAPSVELLAGGPRMKFRTDFYRMKLFCGDKEVEPIQPGKAATVVNVHGSFLNIDDATYVGIYSYPPDAISPACGKVKLQIFSEKDPGKSESRDLDQRSVDRVWNDFRPYLAAHRGSGN